MLYFRFSRGWICYARRMFSAQRTYNAARFVSRETLLAALWFAVLDFDGAVYVERDGDLDEEEGGEEEEGGG